MCTGALLVGTVGSVQCAVQRPTTSRDRRGGAPRRSREYTPSCTAAMEDGSRSPPSTPLPARNGSAAAATVAAAAAAVEAAAAAPGIIAPSEAPDGGDGGVVVVAAAAAAAAAAGPESSSRNLIPDSKGRVHNPRHVTERHCFAQ